MENAQMTLIHHRGGDQNRSTTGRTPLPSTKSPGGASHQQMTVTLEQTDGLLHRSPLQNQPANPAADLPRLAEEQPSVSFVKNGRESGTQVHGAPAELKSVFPPDLGLTGPPKCCGCGGQIAERYLNHVLGSFWHSACLTCTECNIPLQKSCFQNKGKLYCGVHFFRRFGTRCRGCGEGIPPSEMVRRAHENVYHLSCFVCAVCGQQLDTGDHFYLRTDHSLVCRADFEKARQSCANATDEDDDDPNSQPSSTKRPRASISTKQLEELKNVYNVSRKPSRSLREELGKKLGLDVRVVQVWFQNRRAKEKRLKREVVPAPPFQPHPEVYPLSGVDDPDSQQPHTYLGQGKHGVQLPMYAGAAPHQDFYEHKQGPGSSQGTELPPSVTHPNHTNSSAVSIPPAQSSTTWSCQSYLDCPPGQRDAFSSPPHHNQYLVSGHAGGTMAKPGESTPPEGSPNFSQTSLHGAVVCAADVHTPTSGQGMNYEQSNSSQHKEWEMQREFTDSNAVNTSSSYQFQSL